MTKELLTGQEIRYNAKQRLKKHRETMAKTGYKTVSVFMGESLRGELDHLREARGMTRHVALGHIFDIYHAAVYGAKTDNEPSIDLDTMTIIDNIDVTSNGNDKGKESQLDIFDADKVVVDPGTDTAMVTQTANHLDLGDYHGQDIDLDTKDKILIQLATDMPGPGNAQSRVDMLNSAGITCGPKKESWTTKKFTDNLRFAKKRQGNK
jgi:hypothetical protein